MAIYVVAVVSTSRGALSHDWVEQLRKVDGVGGVTTSLDPNQVTVYASERAIESIKSMFGDVLLIERAAAYGVAR